MTVTRARQFDFKFLDGIRALAALAVALLHASLFTGHEGDFAAAFPFAAKILFLGNYAVAVFIVLSGFVLMLPIAKNPDLAIVRGTVEYLKRRTRRILPPYFVSLALFGLLITAVPILQTQRGTAWDSKIPVTLDGVLAHALVIHNLNASWAYQINGPAWSIATEWQLYFALPLVILPVWRRFGRLAALTWAIVIGASFALFLPSLAAGHLWFIGLFAMGAFVAHMVVNEAVVRFLGPFVLLMGLVAAVFVIGVNAPLWMNELFVGAAISTALLWLATRDVTGHRTIVHKLLECRLLVWMGLWSFSLYLIHSPLLGLANLLTLDIPMSTFARFVLQVVVALPLAAGVAYAFHLLVERRFITSHQRRKTHGQPERATRQEAVADSDR